MKKIALLTSGGDAPGMNACIRAVVRAGENSGYQVVGVTRGYQGLIEGAFQQLGSEVVENIIGLGGTILKTSRSEDFMTEKGFSTAVKNIKKEKIDCLVVLGGDGSMRGAKKLMEAGVNVVCVPCTIDNDIAYTPLTIGFDTAINTVTEMLGKVRDTSASHDRVLVVEVMGRHSGDIALFGGVSSGAELILVPEVKFDYAAICSKIRKCMNIGEKCVLVVVAEGVEKAENVASRIKAELKVDVKSMDLGYVQRGGSPTANDRIFATRLGACVVEEIKRENYGVALGGDYFKIKSYKLDEIFNAKVNFDKKLLLLNDYLSI